MLKNYKIIALCLSNIQDSASVCFISRLNEILSDMGYRIFIYSMSTDMDWSSNNEDSETLVYELIDYDIIDMLIVMDEKIKSQHLSEHIISNAKSAGIPVIVVDGQYIGCANVQFDYRAGFEKIVRHIMSVHGPRKLHFMAGNKNNKFSDERLEVFLRVIKEFGVEFDVDSMVSYGDFWAGPTIKAVIKLIETGNIPEAIICANDIMAINVIAILKRYGFKVPEDIIVTGFDGIEEIHLTEPKITTGHCDYRELADKIIDLVKNGIEAGDYYVVPELMVSESCGCTYSSKINILDSFNRLNSRFYRYQDDAHTLMRIAESMQSCMNIEDVPIKMKHRVMNHLSCFLDKWCLDDSVDPLTVQKDGFDDEMYLLYQSKAPETFSPIKFMRKDVSPKIDEYLKRKYPLIFMELDFMNVSFGYACFSYKSCDGTDYAKIPQIITALNNGFGGLISKRYQCFLTKRIEHIYLHDALTGLYNRLGFNQRFEKMIKKVQENNDTVTVVLADLDGLKGINDNYGHAAGDKAIHTVAEALKQSCPHDALCVRFGGDEMLAVIEGDYSIDLFRKEMDKFLDNYNNTMGNPYTVSASLGILHAKGAEVHDFEELLKRVDALMYEEKNKKKERKKLV